MRSTLFLLINTWSNHLAGIIIIIIIIPSVFLTSTLVYGLSPGEIKITNYLKNISNHINYCNVSENVRFQKKKKKRKRSSISVLLQG